MRDAGTQLRRGYSLAINGNISVDGSNVPLYYGKVPSELSDQFFILMPQISTRNRSSMSHFAVDAYVTIDIIKKVNADVSMEDVENASDQILQIVKPTPSGIGITIASPFKIVLINPEDNDDSRPTEVDAAKFVIQKSLRFRNHIIS